MSPRTLREVYLPHFKRCIDQGAGSMMGAYNLLLGHHCCENQLLLEDIPRGEWGFQGFTSSDFVFGIRDSIKAVNSGMDVEMPATLKYGKKLVRAVERGLVKEETIDRSVRRILRTLVSFATVNDPEDYSMEIVASPKHTALALESAEKSMVLLKNESVLPFDKKLVRKLTVIGRLAKTDNMGDHGSSRVHPPYVITPLEGLSEFLPGVKIAYYDGKDVEAAGNGAKNADAVVIFAGNDYIDEGEFVVEKGHTGGDRRTLKIKPKENDLINKVAPLNKNTAVVLFGGSAFVMEEWKDNCPAILLAFYSGMEGGKALTNILFGEVNPSGKLPFTVAKDEAHYPFFDTSVIEIEYGYYHGYTLLDKDDIEPAFPFGFGLSYTKYEYADAAVQVEGEQAKVSVRIRNTGSKAGEEVVQLYIGFNGSAVDRPKKLLKGFDKIYLQPGEEKMVTLTVKRGDLAYYDEDKKAWVEEDIEYTAYIGASSSYKDLLEVPFRFKGC